jgi:hypothetical protein
MLEFIGGVACGYFMCFVLMLGLYLFALKEGGFL